MDVLTAVITAEGESTMTTQVPEQEQAGAAAAASQEQKPQKNANTAPQKPRVAPGKGKSGKKPTPAKKGSKAPKPAKAAKVEKASGAAREGSKTAKVLDLLRRPDGATLKEIMKATGWQAHSVRGFISGTLGKKLGLTVESAKREDGERVYRLKK
jgi:hypothetical protein